MSHIYNMKPLLLSQNNRFEMVAQETVNTRWDSIQRLHLFYQLLLKRKNVNSQQKIVDFFKKSVFLILRRDIIRPVRICTMHLQILLHQKHIIDSVTDQCQSTLDSDWTNNKLYEDGNVYIGSTITSETSLMHVNSDTKCTISCL